MKYYLKWINEITQLVEQPPISFQHGSLLDAHMMIEHETVLDIVYYKSMPSSIPQWIDCISHATPFESLAEAEKMLKRIEKMAHVGVYGIEESIEGDLAKLRSL